MDYDNYVKHVAQKYKIAIAIAVLKEKPENQTIEQYIDDLRNKINITNKSEDLNTTLGSDDFNFNEEINSNGNDFNDKEMEEFNDEISIKSVTILDNFDVNMAIEELLDENNLINESYEVMPKINHSHNSNSIDSEPLHDSKTNQNGAKSKALNILRNIRKEPVSKIQEKHDDALCIDVAKNGSKDKIVKGVVNRVNNDIRSEQVKDVKLTDMYSENHMDVDEITDTTHKVKTQNRDPNKDFTDVDNNINCINETDPVQNKVIDSLAAKIYSNISKNPDTTKHYQTVKKTGVENVNATKENINVNAGNELTGTIDHKEEIDITEKVRQYLAKQTQDILEKAKKDKHKSICNSESFDTQTIGVTDVDLNNTDANIKDDLNYSNINKETLTQIDSQATVLYTYQGTSHDFTHISQSQTDNIEIGENFIHGRKDDVSHLEISKRADSMYNWDCAGATTDTNKARFDVQSSNDYEENDNILKDIVNNKTVHYNDADMFQISCDIGNSSKNVVTNESNTPYNSIEGEFNNENNKNSSQQMNVNQTQIAYVIDKDGNAYKILNGTFQNNNTITLAKETNVQKVISNINNSQTDSITQEKQTYMEMDTLSSDEEVLPTQKELVPFKVIEELNKVKMFLNRKLERNSEGYLTDSGYNSDSQSRSSFKSALQNSNGWVNQSAFCLYNYIIECPLNEATSDLSSQISQVLGKLIDKLHDIENYPSFLEEILEYIDKSIQNIYSEDNSILTNDEYIQRILLLNKSIHIIKYSTEKINIKLDDFLQKLTTHTTFELENILELENICHIFHLLEILIKRYLKGRNCSNDTETQSQEEKLFKKSSITDIWKKKWNPEYRKVEKPQGFLEKKCVMNKCSDLLNKIVVCCMEGYSLVAFTALQCFNLLQSQ